MIDINIIIHHIIQFGFIDLMLILFGWGAAQFRSFALIFSLAGLLLRVGKWWFEHHPIGKRVARETDIDETFTRVFGEHLSKYTAKIGTKVDTEEKHSL